MTPAGETVATSGEIPWWAWALLLAAVAAVVVGAVLLQQRRRRSLEAWDQGLADVEDVARWLHDRVLPPVLADPGPSPSAVAWSAARPRFLSLDEQLTALAGTAPDDARRGTAASLRSALAETASALDARAGATSANAWATAQTRAELARNRLGGVLDDDVIGPPAPPGAAPLYPAAADQPATPGIDTTAPATVGEPPSGREPGRDGGGRHAARDPYS